MKIKESIYLSIYLIYMIYIWDSILLNFLKLPLIQSVRVDYSLLLPLWYYIITMENKKTLISDAKK